MLLLAHENVPPVALFYRNTLTPPGSILWGEDTLYIEPGHPWENPFIERFIGTLKRECLNRYLFDNVAEAQYLVEQWREEYNRHRPHSSLDYLTPVEYALQHRANVIPLTQPGT